MFACFLLLFVLLNHHTRYSLARESGDPRRSFFISSAVESHIQSFVKPFFYIVCRSFPVTWAAHLLTQFLHNKSKCLFFWLLVLWPHSPLPQRRHSGDFLANHLSLLNEPIRLFNLVKCQTICIPSWEEMGLISLWITTTLKSPLVHLAL